MPEVRYVRAIAEALAEEMARDEEDAGNRAGDPQRVVADNSKIKKELGWRQKIGLEEGLKKTVIAYRKLFRKKSKTLRIH